MQPQPVYASNTADLTITVTIINPVEVYAPTGFTLTDLGAITVEAEWTPGSGNTTYTMIRASRLDYPVSPSEGELLYYGPLSSANFTGFALDSSIYYMSAWAYNADNTTYSSSYATASIGGEYVGEIADAIESLANSSPFSTLEEFGFLALQVVITVMILVVAFRRREGASYENAFLNLVAGMMTTYTALTLTSQIHYGVGIPVFMIGGYQFYRFIIGVFASGGASRGLSQFQRVIDTFKGWF